jgi:hypothetical protein
MKVIDSTLDTHMQGITTSMTTCWKLKRTDGVIIAATSLDIDVPFDLVDDGESDGLLIYKSDTGFNRTALESTADFKVGNMEIQGIIESTTITKEDIRAERYDFAQVWIFQVNWKNLTHKEIKLQTGFLGRISIHDNLFVAEFRDLLELFLNEIGDIVVEECPVDLFDSKCKVIEVPTNWQGTTAVTETNTADASIGDYVSPTGASDKNRIFRCTKGGTTDASEPTWDLTIGNVTTETGGVEWTTMHANRLVGTVATVVDQSEITITMSPAADAPDIHLREGTAKFIDGPNTNLALRSAVKDWDLATGTILFARPLPFTITVGEDLNLSAGCDKSIGRCSGGFFNINNYRGWPHVPGTNKIVRPPVAGA